MATIKDIAKAAGVTPGVVSRALNNKPGVKESTRERILKIAQEMRYYPNTAARSLVTRRTDTIGVVMADISEPYYSQTIKGMEYAAIKAGYTLLFSNSYENVEQTDVLRKMVLGERVDGLIIMGSNIREKRFVTYLLDQELPFVLVERNLPEPDVNCVWVNNTLGAYMATQFLIDKGHRKIAHIAGRLQFRVALDRIEGYRQALEEAGIEFCDDLVVAGDFVTRGGYDAMKEILSKDCTAVFCANDAMAYGALQAIAEAGLHVPDDMAVIGFDDLEFSALTNPPLTTVHQPRYDIGRKSMEILLSIMQKREASGIKVCFDPQITVRRSV